MKMESRVEAKHVEIDCKCAPLRIGGKFSIERDCTERDMKCEECIKNRGKKSV